MDVVHVDVYRSESHRSERSSCKYRLVPRTPSASPYSNGSHRKVLKIIVAVLGTSRNVTFSVNGRVR
eukprot:324478-Prymnesium_polylepis.2